MRQPFEYAIIPITAFAKVQDNGDGTWTATACFGSMELDLVTRETKELALADASKQASIQPEKYSS